MRQTVFNLPGVITRKVLQAVILQGMMIPEFPADGRDKNTFIRFL